LGFVHLHLHSQYSLLDGAIRPKELVARAAELGMPAVAITDHGSMMGVIEFYEAARKAGVKPILGVEAYLAPGSRFDRGEVRNGDVRAFHLVLLAENDQGYRNLLKLVSSAYREGFYYRPRMDRELLREHGEGIIALSACLQGEVAWTLVNKGEDEAARVVEEYLALFPGRFYLEIQENGLPEQSPVNEGVVRLSKRTGAPLVVTNDSHYLKKEQAGMHEVLLCLQTKRTLSSPDRIVYGSDQFYVKSEEEIRAGFAGSHPEAIENTARIADRCNVTLDLGRPVLPEFLPPDGSTAEEYLRKEAARGLEERFAAMGRRGARPEGGAEEEYRRRLASELDVIARMGFPGYFLIVADFIGYAKRQGIPVGPGRGSAAGSLVAYSLGITDIDPIEHSLLFERFLNPERISLPDVDVDFCEDRRQEVIDYVRQKYGEDRVSQIITFGTMKAKAAVRDVARVMDFPYAEADRLAKLIPGDLGMTLEKAFKLEPALSEEVRANPKVAELFDYARAIEGLPRHASTHAAGVVIARTAITDFAPLYRQSDGSLTTQFDMKNVEKAGLVKFDFLGLKTLTMMERVVRLVRETRGEEVDLALIPMDDPKAFELLQRGDSEGIFQAESGGFTGWMVKLKPEKLSHLVDMVAIYRPGPLGSGMVDDFIDRRHGRKPVQYPLPQLEPILRNTYGVILYQEQVMQIAQALADYTLGEADILRRAMGKKDPAEMGKQRDRFLEGARGKGVDPEKATRIFDLMANFAEYGFNKSHSAAYGTVMYQTAYLKAHYPVEFFSALLTSESGDAAKVIRYVRQCRGRAEGAIPVLPPDVNESAAAFHPSGGSIRFGLSAIKGLGEAAIDAILEARKEGPFRTVQDFLDRVDLRRVNRKVVECLVKAGAFDTIDADRGRIVERLPLLLDRAQEEARRKESGQFALFGGGEAPPPRRPVEEDGSAPSLPPLWSRRERLANEKEALGFYITGHPLESYEEEIRLFSTATTATLPSLRSGTEVKIGGLAASFKERTTKRGDRMANVVFEDLEGIADALFFSEPLSKYRDLLAAQEPVFLVGKYEVNDKGAQVRVEEVIRMENVRERLARSVHVRLLLDRLTPVDVADLRKILSRHGGDRKGYLHLVREGGFEAVYSLDDRHGLAPSLDLARELKGRFGYDVLSLHH
jgi:DNA polymerase-3 subunit alpha